MERQLANLTGLVQKALVQNPTATPASQGYLGVPGQYRSGKFRHYTSLALLKLVGKLVELDKYYSHESDNVFEKFSVTRT